MIATNTRGESRNWARNFFTSGGHKAKSGRETIGVKVPS